MAEEQEETKVTQDFLDKYQYAKNSVLRYEKIFGKNFVSTGGINTTKDFCQLLKLEKGKKSFRCWMWHWRKCFFYGKHI